MDISYPARSKFLDSMERQISAHRDGILDGSLVTVDVRDVATEGGYEGDVSVTIDPRPMASGDCLMSSPEPIHFPCEKLINLCTSPKL